MAIDVTRLVMEIEAARETIEVRPSGRTETRMIVLIVFGPCRQIIPSEQLAIVGRRIFMNDLTGLRLASSQLTRRGFWSSRTI